MNQRIIHVLVIVCMTSSIIAFQIDSDKFESFAEKSNTHDWSQTIDKRLETIDGVEIASSYKEYIDLALSDLEDRLKKSNSKLLDFSERIHKRSELFDKIKKEINRRKKLSVDFIDKEKEIRNRLIKNTAMESAIQNLADIAGYKLSQKRLQAFGKNRTLNGSEEFNVQSLNEKVLNNTYIEMAHFQIVDLLYSDKQTLVTLVREKMNNNSKLNELEKLEVNVKNSLDRLKELVERLNELITHDNDIEDILKRLQSQEKLGSSEKKKILSIINYYTNKKKLNSASVDRS